MQVIVSKTFGHPKCLSKSYGDHAFEVAAPKLWNNLPVDLSSIDTFKDCLKTSLILLKWLLNCDFCI